MIYLQFQYKVLGRVAGDRDAAQRLGLRDGRGGDRDGRRTEGIDPQTPAQLRIFSSFY